MNHLHFSRNAGASIVPDQLQQNDTTDGSDMQLLENNSLSYIVYINRSVLDFTRRNCERIKYERSSSHFMYYNVQSGDEAKSTNA